MMRSNPRMQRVPYVLFLTGLPLLAAMLVGCGSSAGDSPPRTQARNTAMMVEGIIVRPQSLDNIVRSSGTVLASESVDLAAEAAGRVDVIAFAEGRPVTKGTLLVKLNDDDLQAQLRKTMLQIQLAQEREQRARHLLDVNASSKEEYDIVLNELESLQADRDNILASIRKREVRAPFDGIVGLRAVSEGAYLTPTTRIASMQKINPLKIDFSIPEKHAHEVSVGDRVLFRNQTTTRQFSGRLYAIEPRIDPSTGTLQLRAHIDNPGGAIMPGAFVEIELRLKQITDALMVPTQAVIPALKGQTILVCRGGVAASLKVSTGIRTATAVQITAGLAPGDTVITTGIMQIRPGAPVRVAVR
jgi:membrane fusion protein, multidrug efflux system